MPDMEQVIHNTLGDYYQRQFDRGKDWTLNIVLDDHNDILVELIYTPNGPIQYPSPWVCAYSIENPGSEEDTHRVLPPTVLLGKIKEGIRDAQNAILRGLLNRLEQL